jgi:hypothetical protein
MLTQVTMLFSSSRRTVCTPFLLFLRKIEILTKSGANGENLEFKNKIWTTLYIVQSAPLTGVGGTEVVDYLLVATEQAKGTDAANVLVVKLLVQDEKAELPSDAAGPYHQQMKLKAYVLMINNDKGNISSSSAHCAEQFQQTDDNSAGMSTQDESDWFTHITNEASGSSGAAKSMVTKAESRNELTCVQRSLSEDPNRTGRNKTDAYTGHVGR